MHRATIILASALLLCSCAAARPTFGAPDGNTRSFAAVDADIARLMATTAVPGLALALIEDGKVAYQRAYGLADRDAGVALRTDTIMYGASLTKAAFAYMTMQLVDEGVLDLTELMQRRVFDRFGMKDTSMVWRADFEGRANRAL
jgi:CubicO group peptidase (beta-lactamase class C family)